MWRPSARLSEKIKYFATFPQTPVSLRQMVEFGRNPNQGTILKATQFLRDELPVRLAHRVVELETLPHDLSKMPSILKVKEWYEQSFEELIDFPPLSPSMEDLLRLQQRDFSQQSVATSMAKRDDAENILSSLKYIMFGSSTKSSIDSRKISSDDEVLTPMPTAPQSDSIALPSTYHPNIAKLIPSSSITPLKKGYRYYNPVPTIDFPAEIIEYNTNFVKCIEAIKRRHDPVVTTIAQGIYELKKHWRQTSSPHHKSSPSPLPVNIQGFLDRFYMSRIGIRMLIGQHVTLHKSSPKVEDEDYVGIICTRTSLDQVAQEAIDNARYICQDYYGLYDAPKVILLGSKDVNFMYVPSHLHHMLFELLKNSLRAVVERYGEDCGEWPEIKVIVAEGKEDITIKISDEGGGIPRSGVQLVWTYMYTTAENPKLSEGDYRNDYRAPLAGFGYGLPLSRLYARYFGGDLKLISMEGYGTDAYLHLSRLSDSEEPLM